MYRERNDGEILVEARASGDPPRAGARRPAWSLLPPRGCALTLFEEAFEALVEREGGLLPDPRVASVVSQDDDGGARAERRLTPDRARSLYRSMFWAPTGCDHLPPGVALEVFDMSVCAGVTPAIQALQRALRLEPDGVLGPAVLRAAVWADPARLRARFMIERLGEIAGRLGSPKADDGSGT